MPGKSVMGIDTSTKSLAYCVYNEGGRPVEWGEVFFGGKSLTDRIITGAAVIRELRTAKGKFDVDHVYAEQVVYVNNRSAVISLAYSLGMIISAIGNLNVTQVTPISWQSATGNPLLTKAEKDQIKKDNPGRSASWLSGKRREIRKQRTIDWVYTTWGITVESDNVADAFGVGYKGWQDVNG